MSISIESDLKEVLGQINQKLDNLQKDVTDINLRLTKVETKLDGAVDDIKEIKGSQKAQIWALIGILFTAVAGFIVAVGKFVLSENP
jgi:tetrahydromethanopterin S-methyltransferase subunit G